ncbi:MAG: MurR/RpiR family transcriptional regulator [Thermoleophilia bacterium]|nr:MurR/RpiR family transcriptional regulator [Thermoleophilia bacterium]
MQSQSGDRGAVDEPKPRRVTDLLREGFDSFSRSQKAIARYIIDHLEETGYLSAEELARKGNTSSSTVVRFAQSLGFSGYPDMQKAARDEYRLGRGTARPVVHDDQLLFVVAEDVLTRALRTDGLSLDETLAKNTLARFNQAVDLLAGAATLLVVGMHEAASIVQHTTYLFELLGTPTFAVTDSSEANVARLTRLGANDVLLAIGFRRAHPMTISFTARAAQAGAATVVITDNSLSELAGRGEITLYADIDSTFFAHSLVGPLSLVSALASAVYAREPDTYDARIKAVREQVDESGWLK